MEKLVLYTDAGCKGNTQKKISKRSMVCVVTNDKGDVLSEEKYSGGSNNIAELLAVLNALEFVNKLDIREVKIITDSMNTIKWIKGNKVGKKVNDKKRVLMIKSKIKILMIKIKLNLEWQPRDNNLAGQYIENKYGM